MSAIDEALKDIQKHNPIFAQFFESDTNLGEHSQSLLEVSVPDEIVRRQAQYKRLLVEKVRTLFGDDFVFNPPEDDKPFVMSTVDHHGLFNFPIPNSANLVTSLAHIFDRGKHPDAFTLSTGNVPLNNVAFKRGVDFAGRHINIFPRNWHNKLVLAQEAISLRLSEVAQSSANREAMKAKGQEPYSEKELAFLREIDDEVLTKYEVEGTYSDQCTIWNYHLWSRFFEKQLRDDILPLFIIQGEDVDAQFITHVIENDPDSFIYRMLFDEKVRQRVLEIFDGSYGCWRLAEKQGTVFFFGLDENGWRKELMIEGDTLTSADGSLKVPLNVETVSTMLREKVIFPSIFATFATTAFWAGIKVLGGVNQVRYLSNYKDKLTGLLHEMEHPDADFVGSVDLLGVNTFSVFFGMMQGQPKELYALDIMHSGGVDKDYIDRLKALTVREVLIPSLPIFYNVSVPEKERRKIDFSDEELFGPITRQLTQA